MPTNKPPVAVKPAKRPKAPSSRKVEPPKPGGAKIKMQAVKD